MSFVKNILGKISGNGENDNDAEDDTSEDTEDRSTESNDTGICTSVTTSNSDENLSGFGNISAAFGDTDSTTISNFFGYWKNLINQEAKFQSELNDLTKQLSLRDAEANKLRFQMEELQRDVFAKSAGMDRLQTELQAANKESEMTKTRIRNLEAELTKFRENNSRLTETLEAKTEGFLEAENKSKSKIEELQEVIRQLKTKINWLEQQIESLKQEKIALVKQHEQMKAEKIEEDKRNKEVVEQAIRQKTEIEAKWKEDFEKLRTINIMKEQDLLDDFEWKLREVQQNCKKRLEEKDRCMEERLLKAYKHAEHKMKEAEEVIEQLSSLKKYESEVVKLRGLTEEQAQSLQSMKEKQEQMKSAESNLKSEALRLRKMIETEKENIQHIQRLHRQELLDKERKLQQTLDEKRMEIAKYWEDKLLHEIGRLKEELEQIYTEEQHGAVQRVREEKEREFEMAKKEWENKIKECSKEVEFLRKTIDEKDSYFQEEIERQQSKTDQDVLDLRRLMDKIDMNHHERYEKLMLEHDKELDNINRETEQRIKEVEFGWQQQVTMLRKTLETMKEEMEQESQHKIALLIEKHRSELDEQWENLIKQRQEAVDLVESEYVSKYKALEENFVIQQKSHEQREIELLKTVDSLKNELETKNSIIEDLQNNVDTLEGGIQVLNMEIAQQCEDLNRAREEAKSKMNHFKEHSENSRKEYDNEKEQLKIQMIQSQAKDKETIEKMQMRYNCLEKLFNEVRQRYENRESRKEDLNTIADLRRMIAEQEKDIACMNEEKRYFQMQCMILEAKLDGNFSEEEVFQDADQENMHLKQNSNNTNQENPTAFNGTFTALNNSVNGPKLSIPPTIQECDDIEE
ncbi:protein FAM184A isoform X2 [Coccinella septempunctata]|uniref:protein FAM184A isoform X2 n=1 Tax=Coccinella septempunctata TaxID=41139 RepID=UPI001D098E92|nr:protein FAM184A isoform X2 [Coccinella septempunctata]